MSTRMTRRNLATVYSLIIGAILLAAGVTAQAQNVTSRTAYVLTTGNRLVRINTANPNQANPGVAIGGLGIGETLIGIDFRPQTGQLFGLGRDLLGMSYRLLVIDPATGATTSIAAVTPSPSGATAGFDFNPTVDRIRLVGTNDQNFRLVPTTGAATADGNLAFAAGDLNAAQNPNISEVAYTNSYAGSTTTTLYDLDSTLGILVTQNPPNNGTLNTVGSLGVSFSDPSGFDIPAGRSSGLAALNVNGDPVSRLYQVNLVNGAATLIGSIGGLGGELVRGFALVRNRAVVDYDADGRTDFAVFRVGNNFHYILASDGNVFTGQAFGIAGDDMITPGDYDGDGRTDLAVWRSATGVFYVLRSSTNTVLAQQFGASGDEPVARDYDGDGRTDFAVIRRTGGNTIWYILQSGDGSFRAQQFGLDTDVVVPGDYDGDGRFDLAVQRNDGPNSIFYLLQSSAGFRYEQFGINSDVVVPGDYDGDGKTDIAVYRGGSQSYWYIRQSSDNALRSVQFGTAGFNTVQGDYDGDGKTDIAVFQSAIGTFTVLQSSTNTVSNQQFGQSGDYPIASYDTH